jgi:excisionase family DNA binding protein
MVLRIQAAGGAPVDTIFESRAIYEWLNTNEAASYLRITPNALRILVHRGRVQAFKLGSRLKFRLRDLRSVLSRKEG